MYPCSVEADLRKYEMYVDRLDKQASMRQEMITEEANTMMLSGEEYYPYTPEMILEAISECDSDAFERMRMVAVLFSKQEFEAGGAVLNDIVTNYCRNAAIREVKHQRQIY